MVVGEPNINNIMGGIENTGSVRLHNHRKKLKQRFDIIKKLGQGTYGKVQLGINKETGQEVAIKTIKKSKIETEADLIRIRREIQIMSSVQHPNIIHIYEVFENREKMVLVMEYAAGGELYDYLSERRILAEEEARRIFRQIATACYYCHKHKICHRDLKLENILLDEHGNAKIADFGLSNVFDERRLLSTFCGSPLYASPEIVKGTPYQGPEVDCWSLGVLLYTLVYGAMPFDGSNFKRLVRQISQGDYFEPKKPSRASPLIREMLTVNPKNRANIEKICSHWWVNETYDVCCLDISEELANQTPVRLDLLLSLAPPPPQLESEKLVVTGEIAEEAAIHSENAVPIRSQSAGSIIDAASVADRRILDDPKLMTPKRKLETTVSTDQANLAQEGVRRKEKIVKESTKADITVGAAVPSSLVQQESRAIPEEPAASSTASSLDKSSTHTIVGPPPMEVEQSMESNLPTVDPSSQGAACREILQEALIKTEQPKATNENRTATETVAVPKTADKPSKIANDVGKENIAVEPVPKSVAEPEDGKQQKPESKIPAKRKVIKKKVLTDKNENLESSKPSSEVPTNVTDKTVSKAATTTENGVAKMEQQSQEEIAAQPPSKPVERRRSRIFETTEKFQNMISSTEPAPKVTPEKPKKIVIPGVNVGGFKKEFERKASLTGTSKIGLGKKSNEKEDLVTPVTVVEKKVEKPVTDALASIPTSSEIPAATAPVEKPPLSPPINSTVTIPSVPVETTESEADKNKRAQIKNAVNVISSALEGTRKSKSKPCIIRKPPVPFGFGGRSASGSIPTMPYLQSPPPQPLCDELLQVQGSIPARVLEQNDDRINEDQTSSAEITLKSATLPRRKTTKAEIKLDYPLPKPATMGFKTEMAHRIEAPSTPAEVTIPLQPNIGAFEPTPIKMENKPKQSSRERIIPISFDPEVLERRDSVTSPPPSKPPVVKSYQSQRSISQRTDSLSRQSTQDSDSETATSISTTTGEPIRKSPREYIIPIAVEGGGYVTPRAGSLEPGESNSTPSMMSKSKFAPRSKLFGDREGSEDESSPFANFHKHFGRDSDPEDSRRDLFRMHSLRSSRPTRKTVLEHNDSFSSGEEDDDDGFELLTAENLFSTLLSRVRDLTQKLNVDGRPGFPTSRLLSSHFDHGSNIWNMHNRMDPLSRHTSLSRGLSREQSVDRSSNLSRASLSTPWRRSVSRDLGSDIDSVLKNSSDLSSASTLPRGDINSNNNSVNDNLNLSDLNLRKLKLSDQDALALSYLTPGLSRRIQKQLFAQLAPSEARKLSRTLSLRNGSRSERRSSPPEEPIDILSTSSSVTNTLPRLSSVDRSLRRSVYSPPNNSSGGGGSSDINVGSSSSKLTARKRTSLSSSSSSFLPVVKRAGSERNDISGGGSTDGFGSSRSSFASYAPLSSSSCDIGGDSTTMKRTDTLKRRSRFLRPDFYNSNNSSNGPKDEDDNYYLKEKKERELETQKVLKEIRDRRNKAKSSEPEEKRAPGGRIANPQAIHPSPVHHDADLTTTDNLLKKVSDSIKCIESKVNDFSVKNSSTTEIAQDVSDSFQRSVIDGNNDRDSTTVQTRPAKKEYASKIARPKSYPNEVKRSSKIAVATTAEATSQVDNNKKQPTTSKQTNKKAYSEQQPALENEKPSLSTKNKLLQTIEKKFEKLRSFSNSPISVGSCDEKKSLVEDTIKRLREQSLPRSVDSCITESGLLKRAVSVEDMAISDQNQLQASRRSVTKILNLFKKYEEKNNSKKSSGDKGSSKSKKSSAAGSSKENSSDFKKASSKSEESSSGKKAKSSGSNKNSATQSEHKRKEKSSEPSSFSESNGYLNYGDSLDLIPTSVVTEPKKRVERPRSLMLLNSSIPSTSFSKCSSNEVSDAKSQGSSRLPVMFHRRSLNLEPVLTTDNSISHHDSSSSSNKLLSATNLNYDSGNYICNFSNSNNGNISSGGGNNNNNNNVSLLSPHHALVSPHEEFMIGNDLSYDSWSNCSDGHHQQELLLSATSPLSPCGNSSSNYYSADESNESVSDRIRRKSFYTRFNEKKRPRKSSNVLNNYRDLDLYKETNHRKKEYTRSSTTPFNEGGGFEQRLSDRYQTYGGRSNRRATSVYSFYHPEETTYLDNDNYTAETNRNYSYYNEPSRYTTENSNANNDVYYGAVESVPASVTTTPSAFRSSNSLQKS